LYDVLGIEKTASGDEVRKAYRKRALETHPDKLDLGANEEEKQEAERQFHEVHEAFQVLGDPVQRKAHDHRMSVRTDLSCLSEDAARRIKEREMWAGRQLEASEKRMAENKAKIEHEKLAKEEAMEKMKKEAAMVADMLKEMYRLNPEFAARREAVLQRKAAREKSNVHSFPKRPVSSRS
jgi:DnaJ family protein C protein 17